jgi:dTDP-glucose 4,6-dehydratase
MRIVLTGAAGFIGSHLCDYLLERGHTVVAIDNLATGRRENLEHLQAAPGLQFIEHDITRPIEDRGPLDWVLNFASPASPVDYLKQGIETLETGAKGTQNALELAARHGARFLQASTSECYGDPALNPQPESYWGHVNPIGPRSVYDEAKRYGEAITMAYHRYRDVDTRIIRIFNTYGPRMKLDDGRVVPQLIAQALCGRPLTIYGDGSQTRSFCYISDLLEGIGRAMQCGEHLPINLGNPQEISILEFAHRIQRLTGCQSPIEFHPRPVDDPKQRCPDISRARRLLGWEPKVGLEEGLRLTIDYFRNKV